MPKKKQTTTIRFLYNDDMPDMWKHAVIVEFAEPLPKVTIRKIQRKWLEIWDDRVLCSGMPTTDEEVVREALKDVLIKWHIVEVTHEFEY